MNFRNITLVCVNVLFLFQINTIKAQDHIKWVTWKEATEKNTKQKRKILVDVYTSWCGWCKVMDKNTYQDAGIIKYLNENFYSIKFNAESKDDIVFQGQVYKYIDQGNGRGYHQLAEKLLNGKLSYPTTVFLDEDFNVIQPIPGYLDPEKFEKIMTYFEGDFHKSTPWPNYESSYVSRIAAKK